MVYFKKDIFQQTKKIVSNTNLFIQSYIPINILQYSNMEIEKIDKNPLRLRELQKFFYSTQIDTRLILQAFKAQESRKMMASSRAHQFSIEKRYEKQPNYDFLHISGKQLSKSKDMAEFRPSKRHNFSIKMVLERPLAPVIEILNHDPDRKFFERELSELQRYNLQRSYGQTTRNSSLRQFDIPHSTRDADSKKKHVHKQYEHCQDLVLSNPILLRKLVIADNSVRKKSQVQDVLKNSTTCEFKIKQLPRLGRVDESKQNGLYREFRQFQLVIGLSNKALHIPPPDGPYKAFVATGNNGLLVKSLLQSRPWWALRSDVEACNLVWTEWKKSKYIKALPSVLPRICKQKIKKRQPIVICKRKDHESRMMEIEKLITPQSELWNEFDPFQEIRFSFSKQIQNNKFVENFCSKFAEPQYIKVHNLREQKMFNHLPGCLQLHSKKQLLLNLKQYISKKGESLDDYIPLTFHIKEVNDAEMERFCQYFQQLNKKQGKQKGSNIWICKPGENSNRGNGIVVLNNLSQIESFVQQKCQGGRTAIIQKYLQNPFLYNKRKFDIRCYILVTTVNGIIKVYWYEEGYLRTATKEYNLKHLSNKLVHLTNDAIQKKGEDYGKYQHCNKISYTEFQKYLQATRPNGLKFVEILKEMKQITVQLIHSVVLKLNPKRRAYSFQLFGLDFMLDDNLKPLIIQANSNPCLEVNGTVLARIIPSLIQNVIRVAIDPIFPPPMNESIRSRYNPPNAFENNKMLLIYDSYLETPLQQQGYEERSQEENDQVQMIK